MDDLLNNYSLREIEIFIKFYSIDQSLSITKILQIIAEKNLSIMKTAYMDTDTDTDSDDEETFGDTLLMKKIKNNEFIDKSNLVNLEEQNDEERTALAVAIERNNFEIVKLLLANGANPKILVNGYTLLHLARSAEIAQILINLGLDVDLQAKFGETALSHVISSVPFDSNLLKLLVTLYNINLKNNVGDTPLMKICKSLNGENVQAVQFLLENGADPNIRNNANYSPLTRALSRGYETIAQLLLTHGAIFTKQEADAFPFIKKFQQEPVFTLLRRLRNL